MGICWVSDCMQEANQRCSGCKTAYYCSAKCQQEHWSAHKKECKMNRMLHDMQEEAKEEEKSKPPQKPRKTHCTGCNEKFKRGWIEVDQECPHCGYISCEDCACHSSRGSCYCNDSNFGRYEYCTQEPQYYHFGKAGSYKGDYHPSKEDDFEINPIDHPEAFEKTPRACNRCGKVVLCMTKEGKEAGIRRSRILS